jgi:hypothetical protein
MKEGVKVVDLAGNKATIIHVCEGEKRIYFKYDTRKLVFNQEMELFHKCFKVVL